MNEFAEMVPGFSTHFKGKYIKEGLNHQQWQFKRKHIVDKFKNKKKKLANKIINKTLSPTQRETELKNLNIDIAQEMFQQVNGNNNVLKLIDLTC